ncbi:DUF1542 domain-containing protein [Streptococcus pluranimalium]
MKKQKKSMDWHGLSQRFSIRKYHFGAASILLGVAFVTANPEGQIKVHAEEVRSGIKKENQGEPSLQDPLGQTESVVAIEEQILSGDGQPQELKESAIVDATEVSDKTKESSNDQVDNKEKVEQTPEISPFLSQAAQLVDREDNAPDKEAFVKSQLVDNKEKVEQTPEISPFLSQAAQLIDREDNAPLRQAFDAAYSQAPDKEAFVKSQLVDNNGEENAQVLFDAFKLYGLDFKTASSDQVLSAILAAGLELAEKKKRLDGGDQVLISKATELTNKEAAVEAEKLIQKTSDAYVNNLKQTLKYKTAFPEKRLAYDDAVNRYKTYLKDTVTPGHDKAGIAVALQALEQSEANLDGRELSISVSKRVVDTFNPAFLNTKAIPTSTGKLESYDRYYKNDQPVNLPDLGGTYKADTKVTVNTSYRGTDGFVYLMINGVKNDAVKAETTATGAVELTIPAGTYKANDSIDFLVEVNGEKARLAKSETVYEYAQAHLANLKENYDIKIVNKTPVKEKRPTDPGFDEIINDGDKKRIVYRFDYSNPTPITPFEMASAIDLTPRETNALVFRPIKGTDLYTARIAPDKVTFDRTPDTFDYYIGKRAGKPDLEQSFFYDANGRTVGFGGVYTWLDDLQRMENEGKKNPLAIIGANTLYAVDGNGAAKTVAQTITNMTLLESNESNNLPAAGTYARRGSDLVDNSKGFQAFDKPSTNFDNVVDVYQEIAPIAYVFKSNSGFTKSGIRGNGVNLFRMSGVAIDATAPEVMVEEVKEVLRIGGLTDNATSVEEVALTNNSLSIESALPKIKDNVNTREWLKDNNKVQYYFVSNGESLTIEQLKTKFASDIEAATYRSKTYNLYLHVEDQSGNAAGEIINNTKAPQLKAVKILENITFAQTLTELKAEKTKAIEADRDAKIAAIGKLNNLSEADRTKLIEELKNEAKTKTDAIAAIKDVTKKADVTTAETQATNELAATLTQAQAFEAAKKTAIDELKAAAAKTIQEIDADANATDEEKAKQKLEVEQELATALDDIDKATDVKTVTDGQADNKRTIEDKSITPKSKDEAKAKVEADKQQQLQVIAAKPGLTSDEREAEKREVERLAQEATQKIEQARTDVAISAAAAEAVKDIEAVTTAFPKKAAALAEIEQAKADQIAKIKVDKTLTTEEQAKAEQEVERKAQELTQAINAQDIARTDLDNKKTQGINDIKSLNGPEQDTKAKEVAKKAVDAAHAREVEEINQSNLTDPEKEVAKKQADATRDAAKAAIDQADNQAAVTGAQTQGTTAVEAPTHESPSKKAAEQALDVAAQKATKAIDDLDKLSPTEKQKAKETIAAEVVKEKEKIQQATTADEVAAAQATALTTVLGLPEQEAAKDNGVISAPIKEVEKKAQELIKELDKINPALTTEEKQAATDRINQEVAKQIDALKKGDEGTIGNLKATALDALAAAKPTESSAKKAAVAALDKVLEAEIAAIDRNPNLNPAEQAAAKEKLQAAKREGEEAVNGATTETDLQAKLQENLANLSGQQLGTMSQAALLELEKAAAAKKAGIDADKGLTEEEKTELKGQVDAKLATAKTAINDAPVAGIDAAKVAQLAAINAVAKPEDAREKAKAKTALEAAAQSKADFIDASQVLTAEEKALEKAKVAAKLNEALESLNAATKQADVQAKSEAAKSELEGLQVPATSAVKEAAKLSLDKAAEFEKAEIAKNDKLTKEQRTKATSTIDEALKTAKSAIDGLTGDTNTNAKVFETRNKALEQLAGQTPIPVGVTPEQQAAIDAITKAATDKFAEIDQKSDLTDDEKTAEKLKVLEAANSAKTAIAADKTKVSEAKSKGEKAVADAATTAVPVKDSATAQALKSFEDVMVAIAASPLTAEEKLVAMATAQEATKALVDKLDGSGNDDYQTTSEVTQAQADATAALEALKANSTTSPAKEAAKLELSKEAAEKLVELDQNRALTKEERDAAKAKVTGALEKVKAAIDSATDANGIAAAKDAPENSLDTAATVDAPAKAAAKAALDAVATAKKAEIDRDNTLTTEEKIIEKAKVDVAAKQAKTAVDLAANNADVAAAKAAGNKVITDLSLPTEVKAKEIAKAALDKAAAQAKAEIAKIPGLTAEEQAAEVAKVDAKLEESKARLDGATSQAVLQAAQSAAESEIAAIAETAATDETKSSKVAITDLKAEAQKLLGELDAITPALTAEEKQAATDRINQALADAISAINKAADAAGVDAKRIAGLAALAAAKPTGSAVKTAAVAALNKVLEAEIAAIDMNPNLNPAEKAAAKEKLKAAKTEGEVAVNGATTEADLQAKLQENLAKLSGQQLGTMSQAALLELEKAAAAKKADIDADKGLTEEEKTELKGQVDAKLATAKTAINDAPVADIDAAKVAQLEAINAVVKPEDAREKAKAKALVEAAATAKKEQVAANNKLTVEEKALETAKIAAEQAKQLAEIDKKTSTADVMAAGNTGKGAIEALQPAEESAVKAAAIKSLDKVAEAEKAEIAKNTKLTPEQREKATASIDSKLEEVKQAIKADKAGTTNADIFKLRDDAIVVLAGQTPIPEGATPDQKAALADIDAKVKETLVAIDGNAALTDDEKTAQKLAVLEAAGKAKTAVTDLDDKATPDQINTAKNLASIDAAAKPQGETVKDKAKAALEAEKAKAKAAIDASILTDEEKAKAKDAIEAAVKKVTDKLDGAGNDDYATNAEVTQAQADATAALEALKANSTTSPAKEAAKLELAKEAAQKLVELDQNSNLTTEERDVAKAKVEKALAEAKAEIDKTTDGKGIDAAKANFTNSLNTAAMVDAPAKAAAKAELDAVATAKKAEIDRDNTLTTEEKIIEKAKVDVAAKQAKTAVDLAANNAAVAAAKAAGNKAITDLALPTEVKAKEIAKAALDKAAEQAKAAIAKIPGLTAAEQAAEVAKVDAKLEESKARLDGATSQAVLQAAQSAAESEIAAIPAAAATDETKSRKVAITDLKAEAQKLLGELDAITPALTAEEKQAATDRINQALADAISAINKADDAFIDTEKTTGLEALAAAKPTGSAVKTAAVAALKAEAQKLLGELDAITPALTAEEKQAATDRINQALADAISAINKVADAAGVDTEKTTGLEALAAAKPTGSAVKTAAVAALKAEAQKLLGELDAITPALTAEEKQAATDRINQALADAISAINKVADAAGVDAKRIAGLAALAAAKPTGSAVKTAAVAALNKVLEAEIAAIDMNPNLTPAEKAAAKEKLQAAKTEGEVAVNGATTEAELQAKLQENLAKLSGQQLGSTSQPIGPEDQERLKEAATQANPYQPVVNYAPVDTLSIKQKAKETATLPSTGETNSSLLAAYGALGLMAGLGLVARKKRRDDEA